MLSPFQITIIYFDSFWFPFDQWVTTGHDKPLHNTHFGLKGDTVLYNRVHKLATSVFFI